MQQDIIGFDKCVKHVSLSCTDSSLTQPPNRFTMSPFSTLVCAIFYASTRVLHFVAERHSRMRVSFIRFTLERQSRGVVDAFISILCLHQ